MPIAPRFMFGEQPWNDEDRFGLRIFLESTVGQKFLRQLQAARPEVSERRQLKLRYVQAETRAGFEDCITFAMDLAVPRNGEISESDRAAHDLSVAALSAAPAR